MLTTFCISCNQVTITCFFINKKCAIGQSSRPADQTHHDASDWLVSRLDFGSKSSKSSKFDA